MHLQCVEARTESRRWRKYADACRKDIADCAKVKYDLFACFRSCDGQQPQTTVRKWASG